MTKRALRTVEEAEPAAADLEQLYHALRLIRRAEEEVARIYPTDKIRSPVHPSICREAVAVDACAALLSDDVFSPTFAGDAAFLAGGGASKAMMAVLYIKPTARPAARAGGAPVAGARREASPQHCLCLLAGRYPDLSASAF